MRFGLSGLLETGERSARAARLAEEKLTAFRAECARRLRRLLTVAAGCTRVASGAARLMIVLPGEAAAALGRAIKVCVSAARAGDTPSAARGVLKESRTAIDARAAPLMRLHGSSRARQRRDRANVARAPTGARHAL